MRYFDRRGFYDLSLFCRSIKLSSPRLNNMAAAGCALVYGAVILLGLDHATLADSGGYFPTICTVRIFFFYFYSFIFISSNRRIVFDSNLRTSIYDIGYRRFLSIVFQARAYLLSAGFSLAFGSMFTKTYRVHRIFTRSRSGVVKNKESIYSVRWLAQVDMLSMLV